MPPTRLPVDAWFVDEHLNILRGHAAEQAIAGRSDARYFIPGQGILEIPLDRWRVAQTFERTGWMEKWRGQRDDRNLRHAAAYDGYKVLAGCRFSDAIELGCGPFTNLRVIGDAVEIDRVTLVDPLVESYLELPRCRYSREALRTESGARLLPIAEIHACPIEEMPVSGRAYDLIVMVNVIEHCYDAPAIFSQILSMARPGAAFVFHDKIYDVVKTKAMLADKYYEAGHPLMVGYPVVAAFMREHFDALYLRTEAAAPNQSDACPHAGLFYFIGRKK